ncbi:DUF4315 family protein [Pseudobutyrivibrio xylanivorans]|uniref:DUF4315 family protein n=1 Tax=Pseudobutyrivibrio xylanivorans DSM 14809 TaxID=1123012 RepID=A0A1M6HJY5_PSEXY|nr:DUF4315 family protein [Pseudobutyrivibrio xylanivorans]SHJ22471.1 protein of unknown function [Pseudobutyrivibrio xylanivorans DSM 14809]
MFEKLDKLREEVRRCEKRRDEANERLKAAQAKLKEAEASQILSDVGALKLSPEEVAKLLQLAAAGQLSVPTAENKTEPTTTEAKSSIYGDDDSDDKEESEDEDY